VIIDLTGKVLVVVDMQPGYGKSMTPGVIDAVELLVRKARQADSLVVFLEFCDEPTLPRLIRQVRAYDQFVVEQKNRCDGSDEVLDACARGLYDTNAFVVCGVDTDDCVLQTAHNLAYQLPGSQVDVVREACGQEEGNNWDKFPRAPNLDVVSIGEVVYEDEGELEMA
jgi:nicotinamidase-related amidase